eukprot:TRINITY_DN18453_c0_g1_i1.p1 TRINITY_DN18453_c0_g1~~TRINITY_DN18453_c0_g1_i1.p1  ORF type:complete len:838 (-),score=123.87 TRINITY_DN18453_c0_g1_i1:31-2544(-)
MQAVPLCKRSIARDLATQRQGRASCVQRSHCFVSAPNLPRASAPLFLRASMLIAGARSARRRHGGRCLKRRAGRAAKADKRKLDDQILKQVFDDLDVESTGFIDQNDIPKAVESLEKFTGMSFDENSVQEVFYSYGDCTREVWLQQASIRVGTSFQSSLLESFDKFDTDGDGIIDENEFAEAFGIVRTRHNNVIKLGDTELSALWAKFDVNSEGRISRSEYLKVAKAAQKEEIQDTLNEIFDFVDRDEDGVITSKEVAQGLQSLELKSGFKFTPEDQNLMVKLFRTVSRGEWIKGAKRLQRSSKARFSIIQPGIFQGFAGLYKECLAGLTVAIVVLPSAIAYGNATGLGAASGVYCAMFLGFFAALCGSTPTLISGPAGSLVLPTAAVVLNFKDPIIVASIVVMAGALQTLFGVLKLGGALSYVPAIVISGFVSGLGALIICVQVPILLGFAPQGSVLASLGALPGLIAGANLAPAAIGLGTLGMLLGWPKSWLPKIPKSLLALVVSAAVAAILRTFFGASIPLLGAIPRGLPHLVRPVFALPMFPAMFKAAFVLAVVGMIDTLLTSLIVDNISSSFHDPNREMVGQGLGNTLSGLFGGLPGAGNTAPTLVNISEGSGSPASGMFHAVVMVAILLGLGPLAGYLPLPALAAILIQSGIGLIDWKILRLFSTGKLLIEDFVMFTTTAMGTMFVDLFLAVAAGSTIAAWDFVSKMRRLQFTTYRPQITETGDATVCRLAGPLTFAIANPMLRNLMPQLAGKDVVEMDFSKVTLLGYSAVMALEQLLEKIIAQGGRVSAYGLKKSTTGCKYLEQSSIPGMIWNESVHGDRPDYSRQRGFN